MPYTQGIVYKGEEMNKLIIFTISLSLFTHISFAAKVKVVNSSGVELTKSTGGVSKLKKACFIRKHPSGTNLQLIVRNPTRDCTKDGSVWAPKTKIKAKYIDRDTKIKTKVNETLVDCFGACCMTKSGSHKIDIIFDLPSSIKQAKCLRGKAVLP